MTTDRPSALPLALRHLRLGAALLAGVLAASPLFAGGKVPPRQRSGR